LTTKSVDETEDTTMAEAQILTTQELVRKTLMDEHGDFLRDALVMVAAELMEAEISAQIGVDVPLLERTSERRASRGKTGGPARGGTS
jgi:hypothetical protein